MSARSASRTATVLPQFLLLLAASVGSGLGHIGTSTMPLQIGALIDGAHRSASEAGWFGFVQVAALSLSMILLSGWVDRIALRWLATLGCALAFGGNAGLFYANGYVLQLGYAVLAGTGYGIVFSSMLAAGAATEEPDRSYAIANSGALLIIVSLMSVIPLASARLGSLGIFPTLAALAVVCAPFFLGYQRGRRAPSGQEAAWKLAGAPGLLFVWFAFSLGTAAVYAFCERIGRAIGLPADQIAWVLSAGVIVGLGGTGLAAWLGRRVNRRAALLLGIAGTGVGCWMIGLASGLASYVAGVFTFWIIYMFLYSYLQGTAALLDPAGRLGTLGSGLERLGYAAGAAVGGMLSQAVSYGSTGTFGFLICLLGMAGYPSLFRALRTRGHLGAG